MKTARFKKKINYIDELVGNEGILREEQKKERKQNERILRNKWGPKWDVAKRLSVKFWTPTAPALVPRSGKKANNPSKRRILIGGKIWGPKRPYSQCKGEWERNLMHKSVKKHGWLDLGIQERKKKSLLRMSSENQIQATWIWGQMKSICAVQTL